MSNARLPQASQRPHEPQPDDAMSAALSAAEGPAHGIKKDEPEPRLTPTSPLITSPEKKPRLEEAPESRVQNARPASPSTSSMASPEKKQRIDFAEIYADHDFLMAVNYQVQRRRLIDTGFPEEWYYQYDMSKKLHHQIKMKQRARKKQDLPFLVTIKYKKSSSAYACLRAGHIYYKVDTETSHIEEADLINGFTGKLWPFVEEADSSEIKQFVDEMAFKKFHFDGLTVEMRSMHDG